MTSETTHEVKPKVSKIGDAMWIEFRCGDGCRSMRADEIGAIVIGGLNKATIVGRGNATPRLCFPTIHEYSEAVDALKAALGTEPANATTTN